MAELFPIYQDVPELDIEREYRLDVDPECTRCSLHKKARTVCMRAEGTLGGLLVVSDYPGGNEDRQGRPMAGPAGKLLRSLLRKHWDGPVAYDNAIRCYKGDTEATDKMLTQCRPYLAQTIDEVQPTRIITMGHLAGRSVLGRVVQPFSVRRGYAWYSEPLTPVFLMMNPAAAKRNRFVRRWFEEDLLWALNVDIDGLMRQIPWDGMMKVVRSKEDCDAAYEEAKTWLWAMYDAETAGRMFDTGFDEFGEPSEHPAFRVICVSMCGPKSEDVWMWDEAALKDPVLLAGLRRIMEDPEIGKAAHNEKFDRNALWHLDINVQGKVFDSQLARRIQDPDVLARLDYQQELVGMGGGKHELRAAKIDILKRCRTMPTKGKVMVNGVKMVRTEEVVQDILNELGPREYVDAIRNKLAGSKKGGHDRYIFALLNHTNPELLLRYNGIDTLSQARFGAVMEDRFSNGHEQVHRVWDKLVRPASEAAAQMERWGIAVDRENINMFKQYVMTKYAEAKERIAKVAGPDFDPANRHQLCDLLFKKLKLPVLAKTAKTGDPSTAAAVLERLTKHHPIVGDILLFKKIDKNRGTYTGYDAHIRSDGRIHAVLKLDGTETGRASMEDPNLHQVPKPVTREGILARNCFTAGDVDTHDLISFDYSQLEYRVVVGESGDPAMLVIYQENPRADMHRATAQIISEVAWGIPPEEVGDKERGVAKNMNFATLYGAGDFRLAAMMGTDVDEAKRLRRVQEGRFRRLAKFSKEAVKEAHRLGGVWTDWEGEPFRFRPLWRVADADHESRGHAERGALNTKIQGKASDYCLFSLVACVDWIRKEKVPAKLVLTVHDSLIFEVRKDATKDVLQTVPELMTQWDSKGVPLVVDAEIGPAWGSLEEV